MDAVFTIVAKNYLPRARTLGDSVKEHHPDLPFFIFLADECQSMVNASQERYPVVQAEDLQIPRFRQMAFYYNVLELSCAIKPFCFSYLFGQYGYEKIIYFDPDVYLYNRLDSIWDSLTRERYMMLTPHVTNLGLTRECATPETLFLFVGAYNLGFIALRYSEEISQFLDWWQERLIDRAFGDYIDALHVDQKWMDLVPGLLGDRVIISRYPGYNVAQWNWHERQLSERDGRYYIGDCPLVFFHHTSFDPHDPARLAHRQTKFTLVNKPEFRGLVESYAAHLLSNDYDRDIKLPYAYAKFDNGINIFVFQRRLYRKLVETRRLTSDPFATSTGSFYDLLKKNRLIIPQTEKAEFVQRDFRHSGRGVRWTRRGMIWLKNLIGIKYYYLLIRWLFQNTRPEEQFFLLDKGLSEVQ